MVRIYYASFAAVVPGAGFSGRRRCALAAIALWLWSSWVIAAGCCCEPIESAAAAVAPHPHSTGSAHDEHGHDHGLSVPSVPDGLDASHSQNDVPVDDCAEIKAPTHGLVPKEAAAPSLSAPEHLALVAAQLPGTVDSWGGAYKPWALPAVPIPPGDPFLETVRLLL